MGSNLSHDLAQGTDIRLGITIQLRDNHYPSVPLSMVDPCISAIDLVNKGLTNSSVKLPQGIKWKGESSAPAWAIVESHHLEPWLDQDDE